MTANELCRRILLSVGVVGETDSLTAEQVNDTFSSINQFLSSLGSEGFVTLQYANPSDDIGLEDGWERMIQTNVAVMVAPDYGKEAPASIQKTAVNTKRVLKRQTVKVQPLRLNAIWGLQRNDFDICSGGYGYGLPLPPVSLPPVTVPGGDYFVAGYGPSDYVTSDPVQSPTGYFPVNYGPVNYVQ